MANEPRKIDVPDLAQKAELGQGGGTGPVRQRRPIYENLLPTCNAACPAGENIQGWLSHATAGNYEEAWQELIRDNPMPAIHGRVCYHPCETSCNRAHLDGEVSIHAVERFLGDEALANGWTPAIDEPPSGKRILVIGSGPSGLSCAFHLTRLGHEVEIYEAGEFPGGMMRFGIPSYRLPRDILDGEIDRIKKMGVKIHLKRKVEDLEQEKEAGRFDAVFVAVGAHLSKRVEIPSRDAGRMLDAASYLKDVERGAAPRLGRRVAIYGGGNTAMDAARVARRMGHEPMIIYRRDRDHMPAHTFEADEASDEGVVFHWLRSIHSIEKTTVQVEVMELDEKGRPRGTGKFETLEADDMILAMGQETDSDFLKLVKGVKFAPDGVVEVDAHMMTGADGVFAGGDMVPSERTVTVATGHGKKAARTINAWLRQSSYQPLPKKPLATYEKLHLWYYTDIAHRPQAQADMKRRMASFDEVLKGLSEEEARFESRRCLSCGNCFECDACYAACPEDAITRLGPGKGYRVDFAKCTGCAVCFEQCPCHAITMIPEPVTL